MGFGTDGPGTINFTAHRKDRWSSRADAAKFQAKASQAWDSRVLALMIKHGFRDLPTAVYPDPVSNTDDPPVTLTTTKLQDSITQLRQNFTSRTPLGRLEINHDTHADMDPLAAGLPLYRPELRSTFYRLPSLRPSACWILGENTFLSLDQIREGINHAGTGLGGSGGIGKNRVKEVLVKKRGHLFPFEAVSETAQKCAEWLDQEMQIFSQKEASWAKKREGMDRKAHLTIGEEWTNVIKPLKAFKHTL